MAKKEIKGDWVLGWPDRKRPRSEFYKDTEGRVVGSRSPFLDLEGLITPTDAAFVNAQVQMPEPVHPDEYSFSIFGEVDRSMEFSLEDVRRLPGRTVRAVIECAGNDADFFDYLATGAIGEKPSFELSENDGIHWRLSGKKREGPIGDAATLLKSIPSTCMVTGGEWTGVPFAEVLQRSGIRPGAVAVRLEGWDRGRPDPILLYRSAARTDFKPFDPGVINYDKGLPIEKAMHPDTILAWAHNGEYLQHVHGAPLRLIVPGWAGNWWVKWIHTIEVMDRMPDCYHQTHYFVSGKSPEDPNKKMMTALGVKSMITEPTDGDSPLPVGEQVVRGLAWSGEGEITRIEVSLDGGASWQEAHIEYAPDRWLWKRWSFRWRADKPGRFTIMARATDEKGRKQPQTEWNFLRKHFDGIVPVHVTVE
ncbi:MAG: molybdopterin-dependent oxidoreductase [Burkholderiales bacterium]|nr:molybdopterin-dependent oxidoreductase [Burkholderiales bacterium]